MNSAAMLEVEHDEDNSNELFLTFNLGSEKYAIDIIYIKEITGMQLITKVPKMPGFVRGVINLRGSIVPVIDMRRRFNMEAREYDDRTCAVVVDLGNAWTGLIVDSVDEVVDIPAEKISLPETIVRSPAGHFVKGLGRTEQGVVILLDVDKLLTENEVAALGAL